MFSPVIPPVRSSVKLRSVHRLVTFRCRVEEINIFKKNQGIVEDNHFYSNILFLQTKT